MNEQMVPLVQEQLAGSLIRLCSGLKSNSPPILVFLGPQNMALFGNRVLADISHSDKVPLDNGGP